jgi:hypothetical protein
MRSVSRSSWRSTTNAGEAMKDPSGLKDMMQRFLLRITIMGQ